MTEIVDPRDAPCFVVVKRGKTGKIVRVTLIELNHEGLVDLESTKVLLKESIELFKALLDADKKFVQDYNRKVEMRRLIQSGENVFGVPGFMQPPEHRFQGFVDEDDHLPDNAQAEYMRQEEIRKKEQIERERRYGPLTQAEARAGNEVRGAAQGGGRPRAQAPRRGCEGPARAGRAAEENQRSAEQEAQEDERHARRADPRRPRHHHTGLPPAQRQQSDQALPARREAAGTPASRSTPTTSSTRRKTSASRTSSPKSKS